MSSKDGTVLFGRPSLKIDRNGDWVHAAFEIHMKGDVDETSAEDVMRRLAEYLMWSADNPLDLSWLSELVKAAEAAEARGE